MVIAGDDGDEPGYKNKIEKLAINHKLPTENFVFVGDLRGDDKIIAYQSADIFVMPSYSENFGVSVVEAMSYGLSVIVTDSVGISSDIKHAKAGVVIKKYVEELTKAILGLLSDYELRTALGENGKKLAREKYVWSEITKKWIIEYNKIIKLN